MTEKAYASKRREEVVTFCDTLGLTGVKGMEVLNTVDDVEEWAVTAMHADGTMILWRGGGHRDETDHGLLHECILVASETEDGTVAEHIEFDVTVGTSPERWRRSAVYLSKLVGYLDARAALEGEGCVCG